MQRTIVCIALALGAIASPALAQKPAQVLVGYVDLDLTTQRGQAELDDRIETAIRNVCGFDVWDDAQVYFQAKRCMKITQADVESQRQAAIMRAKMHRPVISIVPRDSMPGTDNTVGSVAR